MAQYADFDRIPLGRVREFRGEKLTYIDSGFWKLSGAAAKRILGHELPKPGWESCIVHESLRCYVMRTRVNGKMVWSIRFREIRE